MEITQCRGEGGGRNGGLFLQKKKYNPKHNATEEDSRAGDRLLKHKIWHLQQMWLNYKTDVRTVQTFKITKETSRLQFVAQTFPENVEFPLCFPSSMFDSPLIKRLANVEKLSSPGYWPKTVTGWNKIYGTKTISRENAVGRQKEPVLIYTVVCVFSSNEFWFPKPERTKYHF